MAGRPLCLLSPQMQNRRILDRNVADAGVRADASMETDTVFALYAHLATRRWSSVTAHALPGPFGVPEGMRPVPMERLARNPSVGLVLADPDPGLGLVRALVDDPPGGPGGRTGRGAAPAPGAAHRRRPARTPPSTVRA
ncbi:hypothetical protein [Streptomyces sp. NPDC007883]|uniref:hypothetical protein n=1 Tax=Streptomyces sp. NPDC007883 TaxID=3155116 RepID=UPI0033E8A4B4